MQQWRTIVFILLPAMAGLAQTQVDLRTQSKNVDFSGAAATKPAKAGSSLPGSCNQGEVFFNTSVAAGQNLYVCAAANIWTQITSSGSSGGGSGSGGSGAITSTSSLTDFVVSTTSSAQTLSVAGSCSISTPCNARIGEVTYTFKASATVTVPTGTNVAGVAFIYISNAGVLTAGSSELALTCTNCSAVTGVTQFPAGSIPLFTWSVSAGSWDSSGGIDFRAFLSNKSIISGTGIVAATAAGQTVISADTSVVGLRVAPPASSTAACVQGTYSADTTYFYQCLSANSWVRVPWSTSSW